MQKLEIEYQRTEALKESERNANRHPPAQIKKLMQSIKAVGFVVPVLVDGENVLVAGAGRTEAARKLGLEEIPTVCVEHLSEAQKRTLMIADNKLAELSVRDPERLALELEDLLRLDSELEITDTGYEIGEIDALINVLHEAPDEDPADRPIDLRRVRAVARRGDLWAMGKHVIFCGDALDPRSYRVLMGGERAQMIIVDPPYNVENDGHTGGNGRFHHANFLMAGGDLTSLEFVRFLEKSFRQMAAVSVDGSDSLSRTTNYEYETGSDFVRLIKITHPEGNSASVGYDNLGNILQSRLTAKPNTGLADLVETADFNSTGVTECAGPACFKPVWTRDAKGQQTDYTWDSTHGGMLTKLEPADSSGRRRKTTNEYAATAAGVHRLVRERVCQVTTTGANVTCGTSSEQVKEITYWGNTLLPLTEKLTNGTATASLTTTYSYDAAGRVLSVDGPLTGSDDAVYSRYDTAGRKTWEIGPKRSDGYRAATVTTYRNADDQPTNVQAGVVVNSTDTALTLLLNEQRHLYDTRRQKIRTTAVEGTSTLKGVTQFSYDTRNRADCSAVRMNPSVWGSLPASACTLSTQGSAGPDRITKNVYDAESRVLKVQKAYGTSLQQDHVVYAYSVNGKKQFVTDANGNKAELRYDGHDRQSHWFFPHKTTVGAVSTTDYELYGYDANGNRTSLRKRDGLTLTFQYDALNRVIRKTVPERTGLSTTHTRDVFYAYDVGDRQTYARFDSTGGEGVTNSYDTLGRLTGSTTSMNGVSRTLSYMLDAGGRRTQLTWPDTLKTSFTYDAASQMQAIYEGAIGSTNALWTYSYSDYGRRVRKTAKYGQYAQMQADGLGRMTSLAADLSGTAQDNTTSFTWNSASQIGTRDITNNGWAWTGSVAVDRNYSVNGLNQYTAAGPATFTYDANGNLTSDGSNSYVYDVENRLVSGTTGGVTTTLRYDPLGRLYEIVSGSTTTRFLYDGDELVAEYNGAGTMLKRFVHGAAVDDPMLWYEGSGFADPRWLVADHQGSIVGVSQPSSTLVLNRYDEYGIPQSTNQGRFQYTGQAWLKELGMYHYKARIYSPTLGRFLQTDPIGYDDQINLYAYVGNDPVNKTDPDGTCGTPVGVRICLAAQAIAQRLAPVTSRIGNLASRPLNAIASRIPGTAQHAAAALQRVQQANLAKHPAGWNAINPAKQATHTLGTARDGASVLTTNATKLFDKYAGLGEAAVGKRGEVGFRERITTGGNAIGQYVNQAGTRMPTDSAIIHYGRTGSHIVPAAPSEAMLRVVPLAQ